MKATSNGIGLIESSRRVLCEYEVLSKTWLPSQGAFKNGLPVSTKPTISLSVTNILGAAGIARAFTPTLKPSFSWNLRLRTSNSGAVLDDIIHNLADIGFVDACHLDDRLEGVFLRPLIPCLYVPPRHELLNHKMLKPIDLDNMDLISTGPGSSLHMLAIEACAAWESHPSILHETDSIDVAIGLTENYGIPTLGVLFDPQGKRPDIPGIPIDFGTPLGLWVIRNRQANLSIEHIQAWNYIIKKKQRK